jgi:hypothetical protein
MARAYVYQWSVLHTGATTTAICRTYQRAFGGNAMGEENKVAETIKAAEGLEAV